MKSKRKVVEKPDGMCRWFLLCDKPSVKDVMHPVLGWVPCCQGCADFAEGKEKNT